MSKQQVEFEYGYDALIPQTSWLRRGAIGAMLSLLVAAFTANAQTTPPKQKTETVAKKSTKKLVFTGKVLFEVGNVPADGINVALANNWAYGTVTDSLGYFKLEIEKELVADSMFSFTNIGCQPLQVKLIPGVGQTVYLKKKVYELEPLIIAADRHDNDWNTYVGLLPIINYKIYVKQAPDVPVDMKLRHYFGVGYWD
ncbi:MAG: hypothetical protein M0D57_21375 [Sphingobacteriales bacterium JAD_PAG50586_3]|nr:MAG: hypothetical protein M0D57_21375 [Sphingobacteriales bacterium JAD_PAG50586_3]